MVVLARVSASSIVLNFKMLMTGPKIYQRRIRRRKDTTETATLHLFSGDRHVISDVTKNGGLDVVALLKRAAASSKNLCALSLAELDVAHDALKLQVVDLGSLLRCAVELRSHFDGVCHSSCFGDELVVDRLLHEEAAARAAALAVVQEETDVCGRNGGVNVSIFKDDEGGFAAKFECYLVWNRITMTR